MSLQAILAAIRASGDVRVQEIEQSAEAQAAEILVQVGREAEGIRDQARAVAAAPAAQERARIVHHARLEAMRILGEVREALIDTALDQTCGRLAGMRNEASYPEVLRQLTEEALGELQKSLEDIREVRLEADPRDRELLESVLEETELDLEMTYSLNCWGGLVAKSRDGRVVVINTLEARLERAAQFLRRYLAAFFEELQVAGSKLQVTEGELQIAN